ncbi:MAG TPA: hypothetical protein VD862_02595 [Candidatus Paceibacterota bacterium]|nr:hypothetical protein [Candidatus Paceibacterota bacterium]
MAHGESPDPLAEEVLAAHVRLHRATPATCHHRCDCDCHRPGLGAKHILACCIGCERGHSRIRLGLVQAHLTECHRNGGRHAP